MCSHSCFYSIIVAVSQKKNFDMISYGKHSIGDKFYDSCGTELEEEEKQYREYMNNNQKTKARVYSVRSKQNNI